MRRTRFNRFGLILTAIVQLSLPAFVSVADARAEAASARGATVHVESHSSSRCVPAHSADCAVCRVIGGGATVSRGSCLPVFAARTTDTAAPQYVSVDLSTLTRGYPSQRAPPGV